MRWMHACVALKLSAPAPSGIITLSTAAPGGSSMRSGSIARAASGRASSSRRGEGCMRTTRTRCAPIASSASPSGDTCMENGLNTRQSTAPPRSMPQAVTTAEPYSRSSLPGCTV